MNISEIEDILPRYQEIADGTKTEFTVSFELIENQFVSVYLGTEKQSSGYNIDLTNKKIVFDSAPNSGLLVTIVRAVPVSWESTLHGAINSEGINNLLTHIVASIQTVKEEVSRAVKSNVYDQNEGGQLSEFFLTQLTDAQDILNRSENTLSLLNTTTQNALSSVETASSTALSSIGSAKDSALASMEGLVTSAEESEANAAASASAAKASADKAKETADSIVNDSANKDLSNLSATGQAKFDAKQSVTNLSQSLDTSTTKYPSNAAVKKVTDTKQDIATAVNYNNITNCITEIPQDINLELKDGTLTLKAGSKVYVPNGFESDGTTPKFDEVVIESDITKTTSNLSTDTNRRILAISSNLNDFSLLYTTESGTGYTGKKTALYYNTEKNLVERYNSGVLQTYNFSLPIAIVKANGSVYYGSIDQVFNGFGYIGSTVFALPGVKGLIPNGRNEDGSLKNIEVVTTSVEIVTVSQYTYNIAMYQNGELGSQTQNFRLKEVDNYNYDNTVKTEALLVGGVNQINGVITSFTPKTAFHAVDYNDFKQLDDEAAKLGDNNTFTGANIFSYTISHISSAQRVIQALRDDGKTVVTFDRREETGNNGAGIYCFSDDNSSYVSMWMNYNNGSPYAEFSNNYTLSASDNSKKIPTTAWVNRKFQVVSALPANPDENVFYFIPEE